MSAAASAARPVYVLFAGVGGQGPLTAARLLGEAAHRRNIPVVISQLHGMSQRGGSVEAATVIGSPEVLPPGARPIDVLVGFELLEAVRMADRLDAHSVVLCNRWLVPPLTATLARSALPTLQGLSAELERRAGRCHFVDATVQAEREGAPASVNVLLLGALSRLDECPVTASDLLEAIRRGTSARHWDLNQRLFALGQEAMAPSQPQPAAH